MRRHRTLVALMLPTVACVSIGWAADQPASTVEQGRQAYQYHCTPCHGAGPDHPGTDSLKLKYHGKEPAVLEQRTDLPAALVIFAIRHGINGMPFFRKTEISDAQMAAIAAYLTANNRPTR